MAWNTIEPYVRATGAPVRVGVVKIKTGNARACVSIGAALFKRLGEPERCNVFVGDAEDAGQVMLQFDDDGVHELTLNQKGGGRLTLSAVPKLPQQRLKPAGVRFQEGEGEGEVKQLTVWLPW